MKLTIGNYANIMNPFQILWRALKLWWRDWIGILFLNLVWFVLQIFIVTGPPATAVLYSIGQRMHDDEVWDVPDTIRLLRELFWPAWRWALPNLIIGAAIVGNFYAYREFSGMIWTAVRLFWGAVALVWFLLNCFFWPFWLAQEDKSLKTTYANVFRFFLLQPWTTLLLLAVAGIVLGVSARFVFPLTVGVVMWLVLVGVTAVSQSLAHVQRADPIQDN